jgi:hypothetical protein
MTKTCYCNNVNTLINTEMNKIIIIVVALIAIGAIAFGLFSAPREVNLNEVREFVEANISNLTPAPEVLGGTFAVTSIDFEALDGQRGIVNYEDGHNAYSAIFEYAQDRDGKVTIKNFNLIEAEEERGRSSTEGNFNKDGNLTRAGADANWVLVYEEQGSPALTRVLVFSDDSLCSGEEVARSCSTFTLTVGDRVNIKGSDDGTTVAVETLHKK